MMPHLSEKGVLVVTRWLQTPPSESLRMFATLLEALESAGQKILVTRSLPIAGFKQ